MFAGCASSSPTNGRGEIITLQRETEPRIMESGYRIVDRQQGQWQYIIIEPDGRIIMPPPGAAEVDQFHPDVLDEINRAVTRRNHESATPRPLLRR